MMKKIDQANLDTISPIHGKNSFLYQIIKDGKKSFLYGTTHFRFPGVGDLSLEAKTSFEEASSLVLENYMNDEAAFSLEMQILNDALLKWFEDNVEGISDYPSNFIKANNCKKLPEEIRKFTEFFKFWDSTPIFQYHILFASKLAEALGRRVTLADQPSLKFEEALKLKAQELKIPCFGLEHWSDATIVYAGLGLHYTEQLEVVSHLLPQLEDAYIDNWVTMMAKACEARDLEEVIKISFGRLPVNPMGTTSIDRYTQNFVYDRDRIMASNMKPFIDKGGAFIAIGCAHLKGVIRDLALQGYKIEPIQERSLEYSVVNWKPKNKTLPLCSGKGFYGRHAMVSDKPTPSNNEYDLGAPNTPQFRRPGT